MKLSHKARDVILVLYTLIAITFWTWWNIFGWDPELDIFLFGTVVATIGILCWGIHSWSQTPDDASPDNEPWVDLS